VKEGQVNFQVLEDILLDYLGEPHELYPPPVLLISTRTSVGLISLSFLSPHDCFVLAPTQTYAHDTLPQYLGVHGAIELR